MVSRRGFTLIELLVVLAIVATLLMLVAPRHFQGIETAKEAVLRENLRSLREVIDRFHADVGRYPDSLDELVQRKYLRALPLDPLTESAQTWRLIPPPDGYAGSIADLRSGAPGTARDGSLFTDW